MALATLSLNAQRALLHFVHGWGEGVDSTRGRLPRHDPDRGWDLVLNQRRTCVQVIPTQVEMTAVKWTSAAFIIRTRTPVPSQDWDLVVYDSYAAALCRRVGQQLDSSGDVLNREIMEQCIVSLVHHGFRFQVVAPIRNKPRRQQQLDPPLHPFLYAYHTWCRADYQLYERRLDTFLSSPRGPLALLESGIVAFIASQRLSAYSAVRGPLADPMYSRAEACMVGSEHMFTDRLSVEEMDLICGTFYAQNRTGHVRDATQVTYSYWPQQFTWLASGEGKGSRFGLGYWTPNAQTFVENHLEDLRTNPVPKSKGDWNRLLGKSRGTNWDRLLREATAKELTRIHKLDIHSP